MAVLKSDQAVRLEWAFPVSLDEHARGQRQTVTRWECIDVHWRLAAELLVHEMHGTTRHERSGQC